VFSKPREPGKLIVMEHNLHVARGDLTGSGVALKRGRISLSLVFISEPFAFGFADFRKLRPRFSYVMFKLFIIFKITRMQILTNTHEYPPLSTHISTVSQK
jgi:hypothetical protein